MIEIVLTGTQRQARVHPQLLPCTEQRAADIAN